MRSEFQHELNFLEHNWNIPLGTTSSLCHVIIREVKEFSRLLFNGFVHRLQGDNIIAKLKFSEEVNLPLNALQLLHIFRLLISVAKVVIHKLRLCS